MSAARTPSREVEAGVSSVSMRVVHVMASGARGGGAEHLLGLLPAQQRLGLELTALVGEDGPLLDELAAFEIDAQPVHLMHSRVDPRAALKLRRRLVQLAPDVVHWHGTRAGFYGELLPGALPFPRVYTAHGLAFRKAPGGLAGRLFVASEKVACRADAVVSVAKDDLDALSAHGAIDEGSGVHVPNAVRRERFGELDRVRARRCLGAKGFVVGTVSRLVRQKAVDVLVAAAKDLEATTTVVIGDGPLRGALEGQGGAVDFLGTRDDVPQLLPGFDCFVLSSAWEGEPIALLEAMYCGVPCIATSTPGAAELLADGRGLLVPIGDVGAMRSAIERVRSDPALGATLGERGRRFAETRSFDAMARRLVELYGKLLGAR